MNNELHIAGWNTANDWRRLRAELAPGGDPLAWESAFRSYYLERLKTRYLNPVQILQDNSSYQGEGFSIVAIQCTLVEFLETTMTGKNYRFLKRGETLGEYEYSSSSDVFVAFLSGREPFSKAFSKESALDFYVGVRCGLLHEARTKNDWTIWAKSPDDSIADTNRRIVYRDNFQSAILAFIEEYGRRLVRDKALQEAFIRKFERLSE